MFAEAKCENILLQSKSLPLNLLVVFMASILLALGSQVSIPWQPIPFTLQSMFVVLLGMTLGPRRATYAILLYLTEGALGFPVFAEWSGGMSVLLGSSAGFLFGFIPAAFLSGWLMERGMAKSYLTVALTGIISTAVIFLAGVVHLQAFVGWHDAIALGVMPFLATEPLKLAFMTFLAKQFWNKKS